MLKGDREQGQEWLNRAVEISPDVAALRTQLALSLLAGGQTDKAVTELQSAVDLGQDILQADVLLVLAHLKNSRFDEALKASDEPRAAQTGQPHRLQPQRAWPTSRRAISVNAGERFKKALAVDPSFTTAELNLARIDVAANAFDAAEARYKRVLQNSPKHLGAMLGLAALAERRSDQTEVIALAGSGTGCQPHRDTTGSAAGPLLYHPGRLPQGTDRCQRPVRSLPQGRCRRADAGPRPDPRRPGRKRHTHLRPVDGGQPQGSPAALPGGRRQVEGRQSGGRRRILPEGHRPKTGLRRCPRRPGLDPARGP